MLEFGPCFSCGVDRPIPVRTFLSPDLEMLNNKLSTNGKPPFQIPGNKVTIVCCSHCGLHYQNPRPDLNMLQQYYQLVYTDEGPEATFQEFEGYKYESDRESKGRLFQLEQWIQPPGRILDVGAGRGAFLKHAEHCGWTTYGLEFSPQAAAYAREKNKQDVRAGGFAETNFSDNFFDAITMFSVLEHVLNPLNLISEIHQKLKPNGYLLFNVPNVNSFELWLTSFFRRNRYNWYSFEHLHYHHPEQIKNNLSAAGFDVVSITSRHYSVDPYINLPRPGTIPQTFLGRLFALLMKILKRFFEYSDFGGSLNRGNVIFVVARKK